MPSRRSSICLAEGYPVKHEYLATLSPYQTRYIKRFGDDVLGRVRFARSTIRCRATATGSCGRPFRIRRSQTDVSMAEISRRAGVDMATLYRNFPGRGEFLEFNSSKRAPPDTDEALSLTS